MTEQINIYFKLGIRFICFFSLSLSLFQNNKICHLDNQYFAYLSRDGHHRYRTNDDNTSALRFGYA